MRSGIGNRESGIARLFPLYPVFRGIVAISRFGAFTIPYSPFPIPGLVYAFP
jgi:hypothetical protein